MQEMLTDKGKLGAIFDRTVMIKSSYEKFRKRNLCGFITNCADTGWGVLDANVETSTMVLNKNFSDDMGVFMDMLDVKPEEKDKQLQVLIRTYRAGEDTKWTYSAKSIEFDNLPNSIIGYYFDSNILSLFKYKNLENRGIVARQGHSFVSPDRFFRLFFEVVTHNSIFYHLYHGGSYTLMYYPYRDLVCWEKEGNIVKSSTSVLRNPNFQLNLGVGYGKRGDILDAHILKRRMFFTHEGHALSNLTEQVAICTDSFINSILSQYTINQYCAQHKVNGYVNLLPMPDYSQRQSDIEQIVNEIIEIKRKWFSLKQTWNITD